MTKRIININVLQVFSLSIGKVYSIKFPRNFAPFVGLKFLFKECTWKVTGITVTGIAVSRRIQDENIWDCIIIPVTDCSTDLPQGSCIIEVIDLR